MNKKTYITPDIMVAPITTMQMIAYSGGSSNVDDPNVDPDADVGNEPNRSRHHRNVWDDDEET